MVRRSGMAGVRESHSAFCILERREFTAPRTKAATPAIEHTAPKAEKRSILADSVPASEAGVAASGAGVVQEDKPETTKAKDAMPTTIRDMPINFIARASCQLSVNPE